MSGNFGLKLVSFTVKHTAMENLKGAGKFISDNILFNNISNEIIESILDEVLFHDVYCNEDLLKHFNSQDGIMIITEGIVKWRVIDVNGEERIVKYFGKSDCFLIDRVLELFQGPQNFDIVKPSKVIYIPKSALEKVALKAPMFRLNTLGLISKKADEFEARAGKLVNTPVKERMLESIKELVEKFGVNESKFLRLPISKKELCQLLSASKSSVNRLIQEFQSLGLLEFQRNKLLIKDSTKLQNYWEFID